jgi:transcriptional regulator with XRE-family HTH domain
MPSPATSPEGRSTRDIVASNLDRAIIRSGRTNRSVADEIGATEHQVWRWRRGKVSPLSHNLIALASALGVTVESLYASEADAA